MAGGSDLCETFIREEFAKAPKANKAAIVDALASYPNPVSIRILSEALTVEDRDIKYAVVRSLRFLGQNLVSAYSLHIDYSFLMDMDTPEIDEEALEKSGVGGAIDLIFKVMEDPDPEIRAVVVDAFIWLDWLLSLTGRMEQFLALFSDPEPKVRIRVVNKAASLANEFARMESRYSFIDPSALAELLTKALGDDDPEIIESAARGLRFLTPDFTGDLTPHILQALDDNEASDSLILLLGKTGKPENIPRIVSLLETDDNLAETVMSALAMMGELGVEQIVHAMNHEDPAVRLTALYNLARNRDPVDIRIFADALDDSDMKVRSRALSAAINFRIYETPGIDIVDSVIRILENDEDPSKRTAAELLGRIGDPKALPALEKACDHPENFVKQTALTAIGNIKAKNK